MRFADPGFLKLLWALPVLAVFLFWTLHNRRVRLRRLIADPLLNRLTADHSRLRAGLRIVLLLAFYTFTVLALARPQWGARLETVHRRGVDVVLAIDTSLSMNAEDVVPSRMAVARNAVRGLLSRLRGDRVALVAFAGSATVECPLTLDYGAVSLFLDAIAAGITPDPGTSLAAAIQSANSTFIAKETRYKVLVLFTDGEDLEGQVEEAARDARGSGVIIYCVGIGTPEGRPVPVRDEKGDVVEYRRDLNGQVVISRLDESALQRIAENSGGRYFRATPAASELDDLAEEISAQERKELESRLFQNYEDRFQYPLSLAFVALALNIWLPERRDPSRRKRGEVSWLRGGTHHED